MTGAKSAIKLKSKRRQRCCGGLPGVGQLCPIVPRMHANLAVFLVPRVDIRPIRHEHHVDAVPYPTGDHLQLIKPLQHKAGWQGIIAVAVVQSYEGKKSNGS